MEPVRNKKPTEDLFIPDKNQGYKDDLRLLKGRAMSLFDQMIAVDLNFEEDREQALIVARKLTKRIEGLCKKHLGGGIQQQKELSFGGVQMSVKEVRDLNTNQNKMIMGLKTPKFVVMQNLNNYMSCFSQDCFNVIQNGRQIYSNSCGSYHRDSIIRAIYIPSPLYCYLMPMNGTLYRKDMNNQSRYPFIRYINFPDPFAGLYERKPAVRKVPGRRARIYNSGSKLRYSDVNKKLIIAGGLVIAVACFAAEQKKKTKLNNQRVNQGLQSAQQAQKNPESRDVDFEVVMGVGNGIRDIKFFDKEDNKVVCLTHDGHVVLYSLDYEQKTASTVAQYQEEIMKERDEEVVSIAVCNKNQYVFVDFSGKNESFSFSSRMIVLKLTQNSFVKTARFDQLLQGIGRKTALESVGYIGAHILLIGLSGAENGSAQIYDYDTEAGVMTEVKDKRVNHQEIAPYTLGLWNNKLYYTGGNGKLMSLSVII